MMFAKRIMKVCGFITWFMWVIWSLCIIACNNIIMTACMWKLIYRRVSVSSYLRLMWNLTTIFKIKWTQVFVLCLGWINVNISAIFRIDNSIFWESPTYPLMFLLLSIFACSIFSMHIIYFLDWLYIVLHNHSYVFVVFSSIYLSLMCQHIHEL